jgi:hypothetical protein
MTKVVNVKNERCDIYIGRRDTRLHFGNPFTHLPVKNTRAGIQVGTREEAVEAYRKWLKGEAYQDYDQVRKEWILQRLPELKDKVLGCHCVPLLCHGNILVELINEIKSSRSAVECG